MSDKYFVLIAGSGETSRANIEALVDDHYYAKGKNGTMVLAFDKRPSQGQIWAAQLADQREMNLVVYTGATDTSYVSLPKASVVNVNDPYQEAAAFVAADDSLAFLLWNDEDEASAAALAACKEYKVQALDLCDGLAEITPAEGLTALPKAVIPEAEQDNPKPVEPDYVEPEDEDVEEDEEDEDDDEEDDLFNAIYDGLEAIAEIIAKRVIAKLDERA